MPDRSWDPKDAMHPSIILLASKLVYEECKGLFWKHNTDFLTGATNFFGRFKKFP
jgi:hypothetical protein